MAQDARQFNEMPLGGTRPLARIHRDENEPPPTQLIGIDPVNGYEAMGAALVNGTGCTYVRTLSVYFSSPVTVSSAGGGNFVY